MRGVTWKYKSGDNTWEGTVKGDKEPMLFIEGRLCVTDLRETKKSETFISPKYYKISSIDDGKRLGEDLVNGDNFELHENNRLAWITEQERSAKLIQDTDELIYKLKLQNTFKEANK